MPSASRPLSIAWLAAALFGGCISSLPDEPLTLPGLPVRGLAPIYLTEAEARQIDLVEVPDDLNRRIRLNDVVLAGGVALIVDTLRGAVVGELDTSTSDFQVRFLLSVPGITTLTTDGERAVTFDNHGDLITATVFASDSIVLTAREPGAAPPAPIAPRGEDVWRLDDDDLTNPVGLVDGVYFECYDPALGFIGGWRLADLQDAPCLTTPRQW